jgi:hypothetical protein
VYNSCVFRILLLTIALMAVQFNAAYSACRGTMPAETCQVPEASHCPAMPSQDSKSGPDCAEICRLGSDPALAILHKGLLLSVPDESSLLAPSEPLFLSDVPGYQESPWTNGGFGLSPSRAQLFVLNSAFLI